MGKVKDKYKSDLNFNYPTRVFAEVVNGDFTELEWYEANHTIDSVTDSGGVARFAVTGGPTLVVGNEVRISGFTGSNIPYNGNWIITAVGAGYFECAAIAWIATEASGSFDLLVDRVSKMLVDDAYKNIRESQVGFAEDDAKADAVDGAQTTDNTQTTLSTVAIADDTINIVHAHVYGIKSDGTDRASYLETQTVYRTGGGNATLLGSATTDHSAESDASWGGVAISVSGNDLLVRVTGKNSTIIDWTCEVEIRSAP